jgi:hypothetical protein
MLAVGWFWLVSEIAMTCFFVDLVFCFAVSCSGECRAVLVIDCESGEIVSKVQRDLTALLIFFSLSSVDDNSASEVCFAVAEPTERQRQAADVQQLRPDAVRRFFPADVPAMPRIERLLAESLGRPILQGHASPARLD